KTIQTRCQRVELKALSEDEILEILVSVIEKEKIDVSEEVIEAIADASGGSGRQALVYLESCMYCESAGEARKVMMQAGETKEVIDLARLLVGRQGRTWKDTVRILS